MKATEHSAQQRPATAIMKEPSKESIDLFIQGVLVAANSFLHTHKSLAGISNTYGYFTEHPVAPLNHKRLFELMYRLCREASQYDRGIRVLDLACGGGLITSCAALSASKFTGFPPVVLGLDLDAAELQLAGLFAETCNSGSKFAQADLIGSETWKKQSEDILGGKPDVVILAYALHHLPQVANFLGKLGDWLPQHAVLLINEENPWSPLFRAKHIVRGMIQKDIDCEDHHSFNFWKGLLAESGFVAQNLRGFDFLPLSRMFPPSICWSQVFDARRS